MASKNYESNRKKLNFSQNLLTSRLEPTLYFSIVPFLFCIFFNVYFD
uniref:Uncharacterized protein n=1 Tax=Lepeophtheirus salmonis TaxID=72036 RepID=A0A0K2VHM2_LEPSM